GEAKAFLSEQDRQVEMFFLFYFIITGLHALHMIVGLALLGVQLGLALRSNFGIANWGPIEVAGLYWHFVDVVWIFVFPMLILLTLSTVLIAQYQLAPGATEIPVALGIAGAKTVLVGLFFMHLLYSSRLTWLIVAAGVLFFVLLISMTMLDYWTRGWIRSEG